MAWEADSARIQGVPVAGRGTVMPPPTRRPQLTSTTDYVSGKIFENNVLDRIFVDGGYIKDGVYYFYETDHLGSNRLTVSQEDDLIERNDYFPYGMQIAHNQLLNEASGSDNKRKFSGKELDVMGGLNLYDFSARSQDPALGRFTTVDPKAEKKPWLSPYIYCSDNPLNRVDPDGRTDYYNLGGNQVKHVDDGSNDRLLILSNKSKSNDVDKVISAGNVVAVPSDDVINMMDNAYSSTEATGNEHGFVVATDGSTSSLKTSNDGSSVSLATSYEELSNAGKTSSYDVHTHPNTVDENGSVVQYGTAYASGTNGKTPGKIGDTDSYGKGVSNDRPNVVLGYNPKIVSTNDSGTGSVSSIGGVQTKVITYKSVGFYNSNGQVGKPIDYDVLKNATKKINGQ